MLIVAAAMHLPGRARPDQPELTAAQLSFIRALNAHRLTTGVAECQASQQRVNGALSLVLAEAQADVSVMNVPRPAPAGLTSRVLAEIGRRARIGARA